jgi:hypothetical protein
MTGIRPSLIAASRRRVSFDPDAADYFARIVSAGSSISAANKIAVDVFVKGCKADGIWSAIKACCLLAGPDDLTGTLVPLVGAAPTNVNFVSGDYNRTSGLVGDGSTKYLDSNRAGNADPQNDCHISVMVSTISNISCVLIGNRDINTNTGYRDISQSTTTTSTFFRCCDNGSNTRAGFQAGLVGASRSNGTSFATRFAASTTNVNQSSSTPSANNIRVFNRNNTNAISDARISFYSIGESLDLALLDARISTYMASIT